VGAAAGAAVALPAEGVLARLAASARAHGKGLARRAEGDQRAGGDHGQRKQVGSRPQAEGGDEQPGREAAKPGPHVAGGLVDADRKPAVDRADEVNLGGHRHRPGQRLAGAQEQVGHHDPPPRLREDDQQGEGNGEGPARQQQALAAVTVGQAAGHQVHHRLHRAEGGDERDRVQHRGDPEGVLCQRRQRDALHPDGHPDQQRDQGEQGELPPVLPQPQLRMPHHADLSRHRARPSSSDRLNT
jgi:hypothetical protein